MLGPALAIARKDLRLVLAGGVGLAQPVLLGLLLVFVFSLARPAGELVPPQAAAGVFWLASLFAMVLIYNTLYALEESHGARIGLLLAPIAPHAVWLGKGLAGAALLILSQAVFLPAAAVFLGQDFPAGAGLALLALLAGDLGICVLGSLLGALAQGQAARESLLTVVLFPLLVPLLLAGVRLGGQYFAGELAWEAAASWLGLAAAFDAVFAAAALILFPFVYGGEE
jgi:heme exporter protein B